MLTALLLSSFLIAGEARVIDGDTIDLAGQRVRLVGIDAPETRQTCEDEERQTYACGKEATRQLKWLLRNSEVTCETETNKNGKPERYGRLLAVCWVDGIDINQWMVRRGHALAYIAYSRRYLVDQVRAEALQIGLWRGTFVAPWEWRRK